MVTGIDEATLLVNCFNDARARAVVETLCSLSVLDGAMRIRLTHQIEVAVEMMAFFAPHGGESDGGESDGDEADGDAGVPFGDELEWNNGLETPGWASFLARVSSTHAISTPIALIRFKVCVCRFFLSLSQDRTRLVSRGNTQAWTASMRLECNVFTLWTTSYERRHCARPPASSSRGRKEPRALSSARLLLFSEVLPSRART